MGHVHVHRSTGPITNSYHQVKGRGLGLPYLSPAEQPIHQQPAATMDHLFVCAHFITIIVIKHYVPYLPLCHRYHRTALPFICLICFLCMYGYSA